MKKLHAVILAIILIAALPAHGQEVEFGVTSSPNVVGSGARALGVGGAFIAIADDATAASWNPAALIILERPEAAIMGSYENRKAFGDSSFADFNYIAVSYPFTAFQRNMIVSFNYQRLFDFNSKFSNTLNNIVMPSTGMGGFVYNPTLSIPFGHNVYDATSQVTLVTSLNTDNEVTGDIGAIAPAFAVQITPALSFGFTLNFWMDGLVNDGYSSKYEESQAGTDSLSLVRWFDTDDNGIWDTTEWAWTDVDGNGACNVPPDITPGNGDCIPDPGEGETLIYPDTSPTTFQYATAIEAKYDFFGVNANLGMLWNVTPKITLGAVYKLPFTARMDVNVKYSRTGSKNGVPTAPIYSDVSSKYDLHFPAVYGMGLAYRFNDNLTTALDVSYTNWSKFTLKQRINTGSKSPLYGPFGTGGADVLAEGPELSAVNGLNTAGYMDKTDPANPEWHSDVDINGVFTARLGVEYLFILTKTIIPARVGFIYDPEPALGKADQFYGISLGSGIVLWNRFIVDLAYQYRWSDDATLATTTSGDGTVLYNEYTGPVKQHTAMLSTIVHF